MDTAKYKILKDTLDNSFNIEGFKKFTREFFNGPKMLSSTRKTSIWREYADYVQCYYRIAEYIDEEEGKLIVLAVELKKGRTVELARSMQRNFVSKILDENDYQAAIVAFYSDDQPNWRLSFVRQDYTITEKGLDLDLTPARRYSYLVGKNEPKHTAEAQLFPLFKDDQSNPTLDEIEEAFSVERVTNDFFNQYKEKYLQLKEFLENDEKFIKESERLNFEVEKFAEQFSKKLMGQLAFLYFIQKKGWLGVTLLPDDRELLESEYQKIYQSVDDANKIVLEKYFVRQGGKRRLNTVLLRKEMTDHEADLLSDCFIDTEHDMPWGTGNPRFISDLCDYCINNTKENFFNYFLEPFFYEGLNTRRKNDYYKRFNCKIPFLNGGLFEPLEGYHWKDVKFEIPNKIFSNKKDKNDREADGIIDIFDRYNFTINENEPLEKDVAVDPEMLGKIFENLLEVTDRKSKGAFYTPREIVHYMCQESLINYLVNEVDVPYEDMREFILYGEIIRDMDNRSGVGYGRDFRIKESIFENISEIDKALVNVRIADPAVGSGAFPLGMLNEIIKARTNITEYIIVKNNEGAFDIRYDEDFIRRWRSPYKMKLDTIKDSIFAVDIEPSAVDIAKLRLWLSIIVDQEIDEEYPKPQPLPNLDSNILVGNSLIDEYEGIKLFDKSILDKHKIGNDKQGKVKPKQLQMDLMRDYTDELLDEMFKLQNRLFEENNEEKKNEIKNEINQIRDDLIVYTLEKNGNHEGLKKYNELKDEKMKPYFIWELEFARVFQEKGGFDIVIGNPPYVKEYTNSVIFKPLKGNPYYQGKMDFWYFFACKGIDLLCDDGIECFIAPNNWITNAGASILRNKVLKETKLCEFIDFGDYKVFETAAIQTMVYVLKKDKYRQDRTYEMNYSKLLIDNPNSEKINQFLYSEMDKEEGIKYKNIIESDEFFDGYIEFIRPDIKNILVKVQRNTTTLLKNEIAQGIVAPQDFLNKKNAQLLGNGHKVGDGVFVISKEELENIKLNENEKEIIKPYYTSSELSKYFVSAENRYYILYCKSDMNDIIEQFPNVKRHLDRYNKIITSDNKPYGLHRARDENFFQGEKILSIRKCIEPTFTYSDKECYVSQTYNVIKTSRYDMKFLLALLNSKLIKFWLFHKGKLQGKNYQVDKQPLMEIPIRIPSNMILDRISAELNNISKSVNEELAIKKIDNLIYDLYGLTEEEIKIVESI